MGQQLAPEVLGQPDELLRCRHRRSLVLIG
jgi:hypothetical protein